METQFDFNWFVRIDFPFNLSPYQDEGKTPPPVNDYLFQDGKNYIFQDSDNYIFN